MLGTREIEFIENCIAQDDNPDNRIKDLIPGLSITKCSASDIMDEPYKTFNMYNLYLVDRSDHCWKFTDSPEKASGIVLARRNNGKS